LIGGVAAVMVVVSILTIGHNEKLAAVRQEVADVQLDQPLNAPGSPPQEKALDPCFGAPAMVTKGCVLRNPNVPLRPTLDEFANDLPQEAGKCYTLTNQELLTCDFGYKGADAMRIALVGDSHATLLIPALRPFLNTNKWRLTTYTGHECVFMEPAPTGCRDTMAKTRDALLANPYNLVIFTNYNNNQSPVGYQVAWGPIAAAGTRIAVVADNPESSTEAIACLSRVSFDGDKTGDCGTPRAEAFPHPDPLVAAAKTVPRATVIDLTPYYCTEDRCPSVIGNVIVPRDTNHITATYAKTLAGPLEQGLRQAIEAR
jgi:hypothetical protein